MRKLILLLLSLLCTGALAVDVIDKKAFDYRSQGCIAGVNAFIIQIGQHPPPRAVAFFCADVIYKLQKQEEQHKYPNLGEQDSPDTI